MSSAERYGSRTDIGLVREHNEDSLLVSPPLYAVCDGMGGHEAGEVASEIAVSVLANTAPRTPDADALGRAVEEANLAIIRSVNEGIGREGMGTTCTAAILDKERLVIAQSGDSRAYLLHNGILQQLTHDHSLVADLVESGEIDPSEARTHPWRSYITRALGLDPKMKADLYELNVQAGDRLMLCSDGLYSMIDDATIAQIMMESPDPQMTADMLCEAALNMGGHDNVSVIVVNVEGNAEQSTRKIARKTKVTAITLMIMLIAIIAAGIFALNWWVSNSAYLGEVDGKVAIYKGIPGDVLGMTFSELDEVTNIQLDDLQPGIANRITNNNVRCDSLESARNLVAEYEEQVGYSSAIDQDDQSGQSDQANGQGEPDADNDASPSASNSNPTQTNARDNA